MSIMMKVMSIFIATIALHVALVSSLRVNRLTKVHHHRVKKTQLQILPHPISDVVELLIKIKIPAIVFGTGYASALVGRSVAITDQIQPVLKFIRRLLPSGLAPDSTNTIFPGVYLPTELEKGQYGDEVVFVTGSSSIKIVQFGLGIFLTLKNIEGQKKYSTDGVVNTKALKSFHSLYVKNILQKKTNDYLPDDYNYFGVNDGIGNLQAMLKYNPFFASALTPSGAGFKIDPYGKDSLFATLTESLNDDVPRVVAEFSRKLKVTSLKVYVGKTKKDRIELTRNSRGCLFSEQDKAYLLLHTLLHHGQNIHATTHLFHQLLTASASRATIPFDQLHNWAKVYNINEALKYREVEGVLYSAGGLFNVGPKSILSGFRAGPSEVVVAKAANMNRGWGELKSADEYVYKFLFKNIPQAVLDASGICVEYRKQAALIGDFATELDNALQKLEGYQEATVMFQKLCVSTGGNGVGGVTSFKQFIELMSASGLLHGCTLSMSRLSLQAPMIAILNPNNPNFDGKDTFYINLIALTIVGALDGYSVFSSSIPYDEVPASVIQVLKKYEDKSAALQGQFFEEITSNKQYFKDFGFIQTDHGPEGIDGKQYTIATYI